MIFFIFLQNACCSKSLNHDFEDHIDNQINSNNGNIPPVPKSTELGISIGIELILVAISVASYFCFKSSFTSHKLQIICDESESSISMPETRKEELSSSSSDDTESSKNHEISEAHTISEL